MPDLSIAEEVASAVELREIRSWQGIRVLAWDGGSLYGARGYKLLRLEATKFGPVSPGDASVWEFVARFRPSWWRTLSSRAALSSRLARDGFHALAVLEDQTMIAAAPGAIVTRVRGGAKFNITHRIHRGTRPLHICAVPGGNIYWGEYFDNRERAEVHIYASTDRGQSWQVAHTFPAGAIRHVHNIVYDRYADCLWVLTGDEGGECKILRAGRDLRDLQVILEGNQQARAAAAIPTPDAVYLSTDTPFEQNHILRLARTGQVCHVAELPSSSIYGCPTANALFFSTMAEPSSVNTTREVHLAASADGASWQTVGSWQKDALPMRYFQYGNMILPDGKNTTSYLAATTVAVKHRDLVTTLWEVTSVCASRAPEGERRAS
jgi:hypothetical protein